ncbi:MAG: metallophosphoesterase [Phycisphaerae bacterium]
MASTIWISGDTHFGEAKAISLFQRPFADVTTMDAALLDAINRNVKKRDVLIHIGDFCGPCQDGRDAQVEHAVDIRNKIVCKNIQLIRGNHDPKITKFEMLFDSVKNQATFRRDNGGERVVLCHYPLRAWRGQLSGSMHLYGHTHGALEEMGRSMDVGVDSWNYSPVRLSHALDILAARPLTPPAGWLRRQDIRRDALDDFFKSQSDTTTDKDTP